MSQTLISPKVMNQIKENFGKGEEQISKEPSKPKKKRSKQPMILIALCLISVLLNVLAWNSKDFCDFYTAKIFPLWQKSYGRLTSQLPFSVGEVLIGIGILAVPISIILLIVGLVKKKGKRGKVFKRFVFFYWWVLSIIALVMTLNCFILYHCSDFGTLNGLKHTQHSQEQLEVMKDYLADKLNELAPQMARENNGKLIVTSSKDNAAKYMKNLSDDYKNLGGYYVKPKKIYFSEIMSHLNTMGVYFPFSMEANYNGKMTADNLPNTLCHELAHTKGYIQEDEANFIAYIACEKSGDMDYLYSGYLYAYEKVNSALPDESYSNKKLSDMVKFDMGKNDEYWENIHKKDTPIASGKKISEFSYQATDKSLKLNGVEDGHYSYNRMVELMLDYYFSDGETKVMNNIK